MTVISPMGAQAVLADTGPLYAAVDPSDQYHERAQREAQRLEREGRGVVLAYPVLLESYTLVRYRLGERTALRYLDEVRATASLLNPTVEDYLAAVRRARALPDQPLTLFDTVVAVLSGRLRLPIWTYDHHFDVQRADIWR